MGRGLCRVLTMPDYQIVGLVFVVIISIILMMIMKSYRSTKSHRYFPRIIRKISKHYLKNIVIPDAVEGSSFIDWLVLTPRGVLIISQKPYQGMIFCSENISRWTQVVDRRSYSFDNPMRQLEVDLVTIKSLIPGVPVKGYVVFDRNSFFPKGKPKTVLTLNEIKQNISIFREGTISDELKVAWEKLRTALKEGADSERALNGMNTTGSLS